MFTQRKRKRKNGLEGCFAWQHGRRMRKFEVEVEVEVEADVEAEGLLS